MAPEFHVEAVSTLGLGDLSALGDALDDEDDVGSDNERAKRAARNRFGAALSFVDAVPERTTEYLAHIERGVLLEAREQLRGAFLPRDGWEPLPETSVTGDLHKHLLVASGVFGIRGPCGVQRKKCSMLRLAHYSREHETYVTQPVAKDAGVAFDSVGNSHGARALEASWRAWATEDSTEMVVLDLGYVGDTLATLFATELIRQQRTVSPLLRAVAAPSQRSPAAWRLPTNPDGALNAGQLAALSGLQHNLEAITGPPGTGKSTIISALVTQCAPANDRVLVVAVQNRAIESIVQKLSVTAETTPFVVHGNDKRLSPSSLPWTTAAQAERDPPFVRFLARQAACGHLLLLAQTGLKAYEHRVFAGLQGRRHVARRAALRQRLFGRADAIAFGPTKTEIAYADYVPPPTHSQDGPMARVRHFLRWFDKGGGDGWAKLARAYSCRVRFPVAEALREFLHQRCADFEVRVPKERKEACERVCARAVALVCTCAAVGSLVRVDPEFADHDSDLAAACNTLVVDEAGTCADSNLVPALTRSERGAWFQRLVLVGDAKQLPPFGRVRDPQDAPVSLIERTHTVAGSALLVTQYRMFAQLCHLISSLYYDGALVTGKRDGAGRMQVHGVAASAEHESERSTSILNYKEAALASQLARERLAQCAADGTVAVLTFYKAQVKCIAEQLEDTDALVLSVDSSQGQEFDHVVLSCVVDGSRNCFLTDQRRMNVALSRAKRSLDVVMHPKLPARIGALGALDTSVHGGVVPVGTPTNQVLGGRAHGRGRGRGRGGKGSGRGGRGHALFG